MKAWIRNYFKEKQKLLDTLSIHEIQSVIRILANARHLNR